MITREIWIKGSFTTVIAWEEDNDTNTSLGLLSQRMSLQKHGWCKLEDIVERNKFDMQLNKKQ